MIDENNEIKQFDEDNKEENLSLEVVDDEAIYCHKCGKKNKKDSHYCSTCGSRLFKDDLVRCPNCGSTQIEFVTYQANNNFDAGDACCGYFLCGVPGLLCGVKDKTEAKTVRKCKNCGQEF